MNPHEIDVGIKGPEDRLHSGVEVVGLAKKDPVQAGQIRRQTGAGISPYDGHESLVLNNRVGKLLSAYR